MTVGMLVGVNQIPEGEKNLESLRAIRPFRTVAIDTETTGLDPDKDEVLQVAVIDGDGDVLINTLVKPVHRRSWAKAEAIHGISPEDVKDAPTLEEIAPLIKEAVDTKMVVGYNLPYDLDMLRAGGVDIESGIGFDVMREFARMRGSERWVKLTDAARYYGHSLDGAHDALADATAALRVYYSMLYDNQYRVLVCGEPAQEPVQKTKKNALLTFSEITGSIGTILTSLFILAILIGFLATCTLIL